MIQNFHLCKSGWNMYELRTCFVEMSLTMLTIYEVLLILAICWVRYWNMFWKKLTFKNVGRHLCSLNTWKYLFVFVCTNGKMCLYRQAYDTHAWVDACLYRHLLCQGLFWVHTGIVVLCVCRIDSNVDDATVNIESAHSEILKYFQSVASNRWLMIKIFAVLIIFFIIFVVFMAWVMTVNFQTVSLTKSKDTGRRKMGPSELSTIAVCFPWHAHWQQQLWET